MTPQPSEHKVAVIHVVERIGWVTVEAETPEEARRLVVAGALEPVWSAHSDYYRIAKDADLRQDRAAGGVEGV